METGELRQRNLRCDTLMRSKHQDRSAIRKGNWTVGDASHLRRQNLETDVKVRPIKSLMLGLRGTHRAATLCSFPQLLSVLQRGILAGASSTRIHTSLSSGARGKGEGGVK